VALSAQVWELGALLFALSRKGLAARHTPQNFHELMLVMSILYGKDARGRLDGRPQLGEAFESEPRGVRGVIEDDVDRLACRR
jgi:hypothetical protein